MITPKTDFAVVEGYKSARTNLLFTLNHTKSPVIAVTSSVPQEGKTTTSINMAITFAQAGFKVLIVEADMRSPNMHRYFSIPAVPGLSDVLAEFSNEVNISSTKYANLDVLTAGTLPPNPAELLMTDRTDKLFTELKGQYDYIFVDTPPVLVVTDAVILSKKVDFTLLVVRQAFTEKDDITEVVSILSGVDAKLSGILLNDYNGNLSSYRYYHSRYYNNGGYHSSYKNSPIRYGERSEPSQK